MFSTTSLRRIGVLTLFFFIWFCASADLTFAEEDTLMKARRLYQQGDYDAAIQLLAEFIDKLKAIVDQKRNVAEAFYLMAKVYFTVGEDERVDENLTKAFETYPNFQKEETDLEFNARVEAIRASYNQQKESEMTTEQAEQVKAELEERKAEEAEMPETPVAEEGQQQVLEVQADKPGKKKFPWLLVVGGVVVIGALAYFLVLKKAELKGADLLVTVRFGGRNLRVPHTITANGRQVFNDVLDFNTITYSYVQRTFTVDNVKGPVNFVHESGPSWDYFFSWGIVLPSVYMTEWTLSVQDYEYTGAVLTKDKGTPNLTPKTYETTVAPWETNSSDTWYRIENFTVHVTAPSRTNRASIQITSPVKPVVEKTATVKQK